MRATINFIAESKLLNVDHNFAWKDVAAKRGDDAVLSIDHKIDEYKDYRLIGPQEDLEWSE